MKRDRCRGTRQGRPLRPAFDDHDSASLARLPGSSRFALRLQLQSGATLLRACERGGRPKGSKNGDKDARGAAGSPPATPCRGQGHFRQGSDIALAPGRAAGPKGIVAALQYQSPVWTKRNARLRCGPLKRAETDVGREAFEVRFDGTGRARQSVPAALPPRACAHAPRPADPCGSRLRL